MRNDLSALDTALELLSRGLWPVPLHPLGSKIPTRDGPKISKGKEPIGLGWGVDRPTEDALRRTFRDNPRAGVGLLLGPRGGVVDLEADGPSGEASLVKLCAGEATDTMGWSSRRGPHRLFVWEDRLARLVKTKLALPQLPDLEIRLGGGMAQLQSAVPPTIGEDGRPRLWNGCDDIAALPEEAFRLLETIVAGDGEGVSGVAGPTPMDPAAAWFRKALENEVGKVASADEGDRHNAMLAAARTLGGYLCHGYLTEADVEVGLTRGGKRAGLPDREVAETIRDGLRYGMAEPLPWPEKVARPGTVRVEGLRSATAPDDTTPIDVRPWPDPPSEAAFHGLAGDIVREIEPQTEADPLALLAQLIVAFGNVVGRGPYVRVESTLHHFNEFAVLVGDSAVGRKGTAADRVVELLHEADESWVRERVLSGLSTGEGLIAAIRDPVYRKEPIKEKGRIVDYQDFLVDEGVADKRLLVLESEFGRTLSVQGREGSTLSAVIRQAWDGKNLATMTKSPYRATDPHVSIIGHITMDELLHLLARVDTINGYANRFLWFTVRRSQLLPFGGEQLDLSGFSSRLSSAVGVARGLGLLAMTPAARSIWESHYERLTTPPPGTLGAVTSRGAPHTLRLAGIFAMLDGSRWIADDHLEAALTLWGAAARGAKHIFGDSLGNADAEKILAALQAKPGGLTRSQIYADVFARNLTALRINAALAVLIRHRVAREERDEQTGGRPAFRYHAVEVNAINAKCPEAPADDRRLAPPYGVKGVNCVAENGGPGSLGGDREVFEL